MSEDTLTEREAAVYDRQIRLWGVDAQRRMRVSTCLIAHMGALGAEVTKNLFLAGINVALVDDTIVSAADLSGQFFLDATAVGTTSRAAASLERVRALNPMATAVCESGDVRAWSDDALRKYAVVVVCNSSPRAQVEIAARCRAAGVPVIVATVAGFWGIFAMDFGPDYDYAADVLSAAGEATGTETHKLSFAPIANIFQKEWSSYPSGRTAPPPAFFAWSALMQAAAPPPGLPAGTADESIADAVVRALRYRAGAARFPDDRVAAMTTVAEQLVRLGGVELSPVAAVMGGMIGQEIVKLLSRKDEPINNTFVFDAMGGTGGRVVLG